MFGFVEIAPGNSWLELDPSLEDWKTPAEELHMQLDDKVHFYPLSALTDATRGFLQQASFSPGDFRTFLQDPMLYSIGIFFIFSHGSSIGCLSFSVVRLQMDLKFVVLRNNSGRFMLQTFCSVQTFLVL